MNVLDTFARDAADAIWLDIGRIDDFESAQELDWDVQSPSFARVDAA